MIQLQPFEIVYQLILMVGLLIVLNKVLFGPLLGVLVARKRTQQDWVDQATELQKGMDEKEDLIKKELENARNEGLAVKKQLVLEALAEERAMIENARGIATQRIQTAEKKAHQEYLAMENELGNSSHLLAETIQEVVLGHRAH